VLVSVNGVEAFVILESPTFRFHRLNYERRWWGRHTPGVRISKLSFDLRSDAGADVHHSQPDSGIGQGTAVRVVRQAPMGPLYPSSNEGAPLTSGVALKNPSGAQ